jgi:hypoxanthine phosphoribosyltransferase
MSEVPSRPTFAHASEAELARIFDFYAVRWEYEPHVFPIQWNLDGAVVESFSPDFYLPDFELYVELTTLRQPLVRKKNRKLRRLRELYPDVRIKLFYARDFRALMLKYGKGALIGALSGTSGQVAPVVPDLIVPEPVVAEPVPAEAPVAAVAPRRRRTRPSETVPASVARPAPEPAA